jgi:hypothetical protein
MMSKEEFKRRFQEMLEQNPKTVRILRSSSDIDSLDDNKLMAGDYDYRTFANYDESMLVFISKALADGKEVAIQAAGAQNLMVHAATGLFRKRFY